jgi:hypothetical protein
MADDDNKIVVSIELDDGSVRQGFIRVQNQANSTFKDIAKVAAGVFSGELLVRAFDTVKDAAKDLFAEAVSQAREAELNIQKLNVALGVSGRYSAEASAQFQELAEKIQATTTVSNDTVLKLENLAITYTKTNAQAMKLTETSVNLAAVTGQDVNGALQQLAGTLSGTAGRLTKLFPDLQKFTKAQLEAGAAVDYFNNRFAGAAAAQVNTFDGRMLQLKNNFDDFLKSVGKLVTSSPAVIAVIKFIGDQFRSLSSYFSNLGGKDLFKGPITAAIQFARVVNDYIGKPVEALLRLVDAAAYAIETVIRGAIAGLSKIASFAANFISKDSALAKSIQAFSDQASDSFMNVAEKTTAAFSDVWTNLSGTEAIDNFLAKMQQTVEVAQPVKEAFAALGAGAKEFDGSVQSLGQTFELMKEGAVEAMNELYKSGQKTFRELGGTAIKGFANGVASGMAAIGHALVKGKDIFQAFAGAMLSALGQAAVQMGAMYILMGIARGFSSYGFDATAGKLIATGSAMSVLGGALMAVGEGVSGTSSPSTSVGGGDSVGGASAVSAGSFDSGADVKPSGMQSPNDSGPKVTVNIHGNVFDSHETGMRIIDIINDAGLSYGGKVLAT